MPHGEPHSQLYTPDTGRVYVMVEGWVKSAFGIRPYAFLPSGAGVIAGPYEVFAYCGATTRSQDTTLINTLCSQLQRNKDMDPRGQRAEPPRPRPAHARGRRGRSPLPGDDQPHLGGEDPALPPVQRGACR